ncbi:enterobactin synthase [Lampropedia cohaerens]|uniref:Enterobactin synthase n=1 Tax=Lampropedia cohaerens TaxID=1610491 RepID=A0A0U1PY94_9BURK|nr:non-ribosomal peptide synthetase [Lampropedia cohaerens]KKW67441.1 enterobactin synthase [Lampropedia cohaerens]
MNAPDRAHLLTTGSVASPTGPWPLTEAQAGLWYAQQLAPDNPAFNTGHALWLRGPLDVPAFTRAVNQATQEAQALQLRMRETAQGVEQWLAPARTPWLEVIDLSGHPQAEDAARQAMRADMVTPRDPARDVLALQRLYILGGDSYVWYQRAHHLLNDGYGMALWEERVVACYNAQKAGDLQTAAHPLGPLDAVMREAADYLQSDRRAQDAAYWKTLFQTPAEVGSMATRPGARAIASRSCHHLHQPLAQQWREQLLDYAARIDIAWPDVLTALTALYCQQMAGAEETVVGIPFMGRLGSASARVPAMVMNVLPLRVAAQAQQPLADWLQEMARAQTRARRHGRYRSEQLRRDLGLLGGNRRLYGPLVNVQPFYQPIRLHGVQTRLEILGTGPIDDITIGFRGDTTHMLQLEIEANPALYDVEDVQAHLQRLPGFIERALAAQTVADIALASQAEAQRYLFDVNATDHAVPQTTLVALIEAQMRRTPDACALEFEGQRLSYAELDRRSLALAQLLAGRGVGKDRLVAVALPRSLELVIALLAVQRAGGAYLPLDLHNPPGRLARVVQLAQPLCALVHDADAHLLPHALPKLAPPHWPQAPSEHTLPPAAPAPHDLAYVIYTSGSTGEPKGVMIEHQAIVNRLEWMRQHYGFDASDRILQKTPATFDVSVWEFFLPLLCGGTLVVAPPEAHRDPAWLARIIRAQRIGTCHFVPSMLAAFLAESNARGLQMRRIFTSGEELPAQLRDQLHATLKTELHNLYGPTEAAVDVSFWPAGADDHSRPVPIGYPVWNTRLYVLDARMRPLPPGVAGDLYLGGIQLARGYLGREDLTAASFLSDPHRPGERIYKSGDLARWRRDGALEYIGRSDHQVKLRGLRVELGEIEAAMHDSGLIQRGSVIVREDRPGDRKLVAYVQPGPGYDATALRRHIASLVPDYMVPAAIVALAHWPVTANGKLDRKALPAPDFGSDAGQPLSTPTEQQLGEIWAELLQLPREKIHADSDFFQLGGDSLLAVQLLLEVQQRWQRNPGLGALFGKPVLADFAALIDDAQVRFDSGLAPVIQLAHTAAATQREIDGPLFVIHPAGGICWGYRHLARALSRPDGGADMAPCAVYGLQSPALDPHQPLPDSIDALAAQYVQRVLEIQPQGPIHLLGWSVGGIIAQAMAVELQQRGIATGLVALLDAYPAEVWRAEPEPTPIQALRALLAIAGHDPEGHSELDTREKVIAFLRSSDTALGHLPDDALEGVVRVVTDTNRLIRQHHHRRYAGRLIHVRASADHADKPHLQASLWRPYADELVSIEVPFLHAELTGPAATEAIVRQLRR